MAPSEAAQTGWSLTSHLSERIPKTLSVSDHPVRSILEAARYRACASPKGGFAAFSGSRGHPSSVRRGIRRGKNFVKKTKRYGFVSLCLCVFLCPQPVRRISTHDHISSHRVRGGAGSDRIPSGIQHRSSDSIAVVSR